MFHSHIIIFIIHLNKDSSLSYVLYYMIGDRTTECVTQTSRWIVKHISYDEEEETETETERHNERQAG